MTITEIAKLAGVSTATVSLVLNDKPGVSQKTRERVLEIVTSENYTPRHRQNKSSETSSSSVLLVSFRKNLQIISDTAFFNALYDGIESETRHRNYFLTLLQIKSFADLSRFIKNYEKSASLEGIILIGTELDDEDIRMFSSFHYPMVIVDNSAFPQNFCSVSINNIQASFNAIQYLIDRGHRRIGYLKSAVRINNFRERAAGVRLALEKNGLSLNEQDIYSLTPLTGTAFAEMEAQMHTQNPKDLPSAFFADNDIIALDAMRALASAGIRIPEDVSVIGFDNSPLAEIASPELTSVRIDAPLYCRAILDQLLAQVHQNIPGSTKTLINTEIITRNSVRTLS